MMVVNCVESSNDSHDDIDNGHGGGTIVMITLIVLEEIVMPGSALYAASGDDSHRDTDGDNGTHGGGGGDGDADSADGRGD